VWSLPKDYDPEEVFKFLGKKFPIARKGRTNLTLAVPKKQAAQLVAEKNSQIFQSSCLLGVMFDKPPQKRRQDVKKPPPITTMSPPSHSQRLAEQESESSTVASPRPDILSAGGGIFSPRPAPLPSSFAKSFAADATNLSGKSSPPSHTQRFADKADSPTVNSPRPDLYSAGGGIFSPRPAPQPKSFADSFAKDSDKADKKDLNQIKGMPKVGQVTLKLLGKRTEFVVQVFPDKLFILVMQIDKICHINRCGFNELRAKMGISKNDIETVLGGDSPFADFLARQILAKLRKRDRPMILATGFPRNVNSDIGTSVIKTVVQIVNQLI